MGLDEAEVGMGNDFELTGEKIPFMWKILLDSKLMPSYIEQGCSLVKSQHTETKPSHPSVKKTETSCICPISPERWRDLIDLISRSTPVPPECVEDWHRDSMKQEIYDSNAAPHAVSHPNSPQDGVWSHQTLVSSDQLPDQAAGQQVQPIVTQGSEPTPIILPENTRQYSTKPTELTSPQYSYPTPCDEHRLDPQADTSGSWGVALTIPHETYHQTNFVAQNYVFRGNDISQTTGDTVASGSWLVGSNASESNVAPVLGHHDQGGT